MKKVTVVGVGALGSHFILFARNLHIELWMVDFDRVETKNIQSQFHSFMGQGKNKAVAMQAAMKGLFKRDVSKLTSKLAGDNAVSILGGSNLIVDCTDNFEARGIIQAFSKDHGVDCLHGCLSADGQFARAVWTEHFRPDKEDVDGGATCEDGRNLSFHAFAASVMVQTIERYLESGVKQSWQATPLSVVRLA